MSTSTERATQSEAPLLSFDYVAIVLAALSGVIHLYEGYEDFGEGVLAILFILAGLGFLAWVVLLFIGFDKKTLYLAGFVFTAIQFVGYFVIRWPNIYEGIGLVDKVVQLLLMIVLVLLYRQRY